MTKKELLDDFNSGKCAIQWHTINAKASAFYLNGESKTIRFDTYLAIVKPNMVTAWDFCCEYPFANEATRDAFVEKFNYIKKRG